MKKERIYYFDILKFIAIFFVCSYHFSWIGEIEYSENMSILNMLKKCLLGINSICIPLFFMVNGALMLSRNIETKDIIKKVFELLIQFFVWRAITIVLIAIYYKINLIKNGVFELINAVFFFGNTESIDYAHFWFIPILVCIYLLTPLINKFFYDKEDKYKFILVVIFLTISILITDINILKLPIPYVQNINFDGFNNLNPFRWFVGPMLCYFIYGALLHKYKEKIKVKNIILFLLFFVGAILLFVEWYVEQRYGMEWDIVFDGYNTFATLLMASSIFILCSRLPNAKIANNKIISAILCVLGENTLTVYYCHWIFGTTILTFIWSKFINSYGFLLNYTKALVMVVIFSLLGMLLKKIPVVKKIFH